MSEDSLPSQPTIFDPVILDGDSVHNLVTSEAVEPEPEPEPKSEPESEPESSSALDGASILPPGAVLVIGESVE